MVNGRVNHVRTNMNTEFANDEDTKTIANQAQRNHKQDKKCLLPRCPQEAMAGDEARNKQNQAGANAAAFGGDLQCYAGELKHQTVLEKRRACEQEKPFREHRRAVLQEGFNPDDG